MENRASNTFLKGLNTDRHPLTSSNEEMIEARNTELIQVGEGYQLVLQKREGNLMLTKLHHYDAVWDMPTLFTIGDYVLYNNSVYRALLNGNGQNPETSTTYWVLEPELSAGLDDGFIPLAVKEFNNVAYIISVNPATTEGEIGTFPSPDYSKLEYVQGSTSLGGANISLKADGWDPTADSAEYSFTLSSSSALVVDEINGALTVPTLLPSPKFIIRNNGANLDSYTISLTGTGASNITTLVAGVPYDPFSKPSLSFNQTVEITFRLINPYGSTPINELPVLVTITPVTGPVTSAKTYSFKYKTTVVLYIARDGWGDTTPVPAVDGLYDSVAYLGASYFYSWYSNDSTMAMISADISANPAGNPCYFYITPPLKFDTYLSDNDDISQQRDIDFYITAQGAGAPIYFHISYTQDVNPN